MSQRRETAAPVLAGGAGAGAEEELYSPSFLSGAAVANLTYTVFPAAHPGELHNAPHNHTDRWVLFASGPAVITVPSDPAPLGAFAYPGTRAESLLAGKFSLAHHVWDMYVFSILRNFTRRRKGMYVIMLSSNVPPDYYLACFRSF
ncbi:hypothetical protein F4809DRAFT_641059 [Biscogniauxia mediterranea]|nr:hypothetical protein F4809DRAFT_641059 [Biscogniauxia mediterranea]